MRGITTVILGGGRGTRLFPLTLERAKPAVAFAGKYRLIDIPISNCINSGLKRVFVLTQFLSASLHRHIMQTYQFDAFTDGFVDILAAEQTPQGQDWFQGTADAVRATLRHVTYYTADQVLVLSGDHLYRMDYAQLIDFHRQSRADITLCVHPVSRPEATRMGLLRVSDDGVVQEFVEKPKEAAVLDHFRAPEKLCGQRQAGDCYLGSMGVYVFRPEVLLEALADPSQTDFGKEIIPFSIGRYRVMAFPFDGYWQDIGTIGSFFDANIGLAQPEPPFSLYSPRWPFYTRFRALPPSRVIHSDIRDSLIVEGSDINGAHITDSIVGVRSTVRKETFLKDVVMLGADFYEGEQVLYGGEPPGPETPPLGIGRACILERVIIDKNARVGDRVCIRSQEGAPDSEHDSYWVRDGITIIKKGAVIPPGTEI